MCPQSLRRFQSRSLSSSRHYWTTEIFCQRNKHQTDRPRANNQHVLSRAQSGIRDSLHDTGERFDERGVTEVGFGFELQQVFSDEPRGDDNGFGIRAVQEL